MLDNNTEVAFTYDDVALKPRYADILPSETNVESLFSKRIKVKIPITSSAMDTVTESAMAIGMARYGGIGVIHKNLTPDLQAQQVKSVKKSHSAGTTSALDESGKLRVAAAIGVNDRERAEKLVSADVDALVVDTAHGHSKGVIEAVARLKKTIPRC